MDAMAKAFGAIMLGMMGIFFFVIFGTLLGAIGGWVVGLFFSETILGIVSQIGIKNITMFQLGAFLGFIGGFLKTKVTATVESKK